MSSTPPFDSETTHRWLAVELNNHAWDLVEKSSRSASEDNAMIQAAHAAHYHWSKVGNVLNEQRALCLIACAYGKVGWAEPAEHFALKCLEASEANAESQTSFDRATALAAAALAAHVTGDDNAAAAHTRRAREAAAGFDAAELAVVNTILP